MRYQLSVCTIRKHTFKYTFYNSNCQWVNGPEKCGQNEDIHEYSRRRNSVYEFSVNVSFLTLSVFDGTFGSGGSLPAT